MKRKYKIAELVFEMDPKFEPLISRSKKYLYDGEEAPLRCIELTENGLSVYREKYKNANDGLIEYMITGSLFYRELLTQSGLLLHSSAVARDGKAYLFSAPSGTGKSTHTALWLKEFPEAEIINDDKPAIRLFEDEIYVYGTPWSGKTDLSQNKKIPLQAIAFLSRGEENTICPMPAEKSIQNLLSQTVRVGGKNGANALLDLIEKVILRVPIYDFTCNMNPDAPHVSYEAMSKGDLK
jgi:hypothetical protein